MLHPLVSVVMPVRNGERWLSDAVDGLLAQTLRDCEILIVDDGSSDATPEILREYERCDDRVRVLRQSTLGLVTALNRGLEEAKGPLVARLDADDVALPERLQQQLVYMQHNNGVGLLGSWAERIDTEGRSIGSLTPPTDERVLSALLQRINPMIHSTVMMRRELVRRLGGYRDAFRGAEDYDLWLRISEVAGVANLPERLIQYRWHSDNVTNQQGMRQAFSARLARLSTRLRRSGKPDPALALTTPPDWRSADAETAFYADEALLYRALDVGDAKSWNAGLDATDLSPILRHDVELTYQERRLAALAMARHLRNSRGRYRFGTLNLLLRLMREQPKIALKALWGTLSMHEPQNSGGQ